MMKKKKKEEENDWRRVDSMRVRLTHRVKLRIGSFFF